MNELLMVCERIARTNDRLKGSLQIIESSSL